MQFQKSSFIKMKNLLLQKLKCSFLDKICQKSLLTDALIYLKSLQKRR